MKNAEIVQKNVVDELAWDPQVNSAHIAVTVSDGGVVRLDGKVGSFAEKLAAEKARSASRACRPWPMNSTSSCCRAICCPMSGSPRLRLMP
jgi:hypothetical protein